MIRTLALVSSISALLLLSAWGARVGQPEVCMKSPIVYELDIQLHGDSEIRVPVCSQRTEIGSEAIQLRQIVDLVNSKALDQAALLDFLELRLRRPISLRVRMDRPLSLQISGSQITIGIDALESAGQLESALLRVALRQNHSRQRSELHEVLLADLLMQAALGQLSPTDPVFGRGGHIGSGGSSDILKAFEGGPSVCKSPWRLPSKWEVCSESAQVGNHENLRHLILDFRSLLIKQEGLVRQSEDAKSWRTWDGEIFELTERLVLARTEADLWNLAHSFVHRIDIESPFSKPLILDLLVESAGATENLEEDLFKNYPGRVIAFRNDRGYRLRVEGPWIRLPTSPAPKVHLIVSCGAPRPQKILNSPAERVVVVCGESLRGMDALIRQDWNDFALQNATAKIRVIHRDSLKLAFDRGLPIDTLLRGDFKNLSAPERLLVGAKHLEENKKTGLIENRGPLAALEFFRL